jgi:hypothetical protein
MATFVVLARFIPGGVRTVNNTSARPGLQHTLRAAHRAAQ